MLIGKIFKKQQIKKIVIPNEVNLDIFVSANLLKYRFPKAEIEYVKDKLNISEEYIKNPEIALLGVGRSFNSDLNNFIFSLSIRYNASIIYNIAVKFFKGKLTPVEKYPYLFSLSIIAVAERFVGFLNLKDLDLNYIFSQFWNLNKLDFILSLKPSYEIGKIIYKIVSHKGKFYFDMFTGYSDFVEKLHDALFNELILSKMKK